MARSTQDFSSDITPPFTYLTA